MTTIAGTHDSVTWQPAHATRSPSLLVYRHARASPPGDAIEWWRIRLTDGCIWSSCWRAGGKPRLTRRILMFLGDRHLKTEDGIDAWPLDRFTAAVADRSLWP